MRHLLLPLLLLAATSAVADDPAAGPEQFGEPLRLTEVTPVTDILADPDAFAGKRVRVEGRVADVCPMMGCWLELAADEATALRVKVEDGVIVFPQSLTGRKAVVEGEVRILDLTREQYEGWRRHLAEEKGETFDPATVVGDGPFRMVEIAGSGAEVE